MVTISAYRDYKNNHEQLKTLLLETFKKSYQEDPVGERMNYLFLEIDAIVFS